MKKQNDRCPLQQECERTCKVAGHERHCDYYVNNRYGTSGIPDQDEILDAEEAEKTRKREEEYFASISEDENEDADSTCLCESCTCTGCHTECFGHCQGCGNPIDHCNSYQTEGEKVLAASGEPKDDRGSMTEDGELFPNGTECRRHVLARAWKAAGKAQAIHVCEDQPDGVKIWLNTAEPAEYWVLTHDGEVCGEQIEYCPYCEANLKIGCGDVLLAPIQITRPTSSAAATAAADQTAAAPEQPASASTTAEPAADVCEMEASAGTTKDALPTPFDYSGLDDQMVADLHLAEREYSSGKKLAEMGLRRMADGVAMAHDALCCTVATFCRNGGNGHFESPEQSFGAWCESMDLNRKAAERLLQVSKLMDGSSPREQKVLEELSPSLLYAAAKPSAPAELVQAVKNGDITTHRQYREMEAQLKAEREARERAEHREEEARAAAHKYHVELEDVRANQNALLDREGEYIARIQELEDRPVEVAVQEPDPAEVERLARERADGLTAELRGRLKTAESNIQRMHAQRENLESQLESWREAAQQKSVLTADNVRPMAQDLAASVKTLYNTFLLAAESLRGEEYQQCAAPLIDALESSLTGLRAHTGTHAATIYQEDEDFE